MRMFAEDHQHCAQAIMALAHGYWAAGRIEDAGQLLEQSRERVRAKFGANHVRIHELSIELAICAADNGQIDRAESLAQEIEKALINASSMLAPLRAHAAAIRGRCFYLTNRAADAEPLIREALEVLTVRQKNEGRTHETRVLLGLVLAAQGRFAEAEPELSNGYEALKNSDPRLPYTARRKTQEALDALIQCADDLNRPAEAEKWRAERQRMTSANNP
jgi:ATP/maltotriose-dependent transcriptional regulator MalT